ncbi:MAG: hypothetical protein CO125_04620 [Hydrogenophilales bacterium CG_4_9_14_3_um_filter_59_35]|nr:MAG: hypothetical protein COW70_15025 [Hydrogenophilales bacterium CG18_big_fil_WC_8_21_14_2_50_58_12]PIY00980.1 MAG: hypothetical protein COZ23_05685 [Hydrogenophilales bacterium CG_4_10_14_3_um_filter_58_23]PJB07570.1 MAG: hypothetical protein CO125_04620 [Hydrogenophilales bacterium CG_4_9_14_3_um_filter_59_35]
MGIGTAMEIGLEALGKDVTPGNLLARAQTAMEIYPIHHVEIVLAALYVHSAGQRDPDLSRLAEDLAEGVDRVWNQITIKGE